MSADEIFILLGRMRWAAIAGADNERELAHCAKRLQGVQQLVRDLMPGRVAFAALAAEFAAREVPISEFSWH